jgi:hypothetical protein
MPHKDPVARRAWHAAFWRRRRAEGHPSVKTKSEAEVARQGRRYKDDPNVRGKMIRKAVTAKRKARAKEKELPPALRDAVAALRTLKRELEPARARH